MIAKNENGMTLLELLVAMFIAGIAVTLILGAYSATIRVWNRYSSRIEASNTTWSNYLKIQHVFSKADEIRKKTSNEWEAYKNKVKIAELNYRDSALELKDSIVRWKAEADSFSLEMVDSSGGISVWQCAVMCSKRKEKAGMAWRAVCRGQDNDTLSMVFVR